MTNQEIWMAMSIDEVFLDGTMPEDGVGPWTDWKKVYDQDVIPKELIESARDEPMFVELMGKFYPQHADKSKQH